MNDEQVYYNKSFYFKRVVGDDTAAIKTLLNIILRITEN